MKRIASLLLAGALLVTGCGGAAKTDTAKTDSAKSGGPVNITIAAITSLSGSYSAFGESLKYGAELALKDKTPDLEKAGYKVNFLVMDDQMKPEQGTQLADQLLTRKDVVAVVGPLISGVAIPVTQKFAAENLVAVTPSSTNPQVTERGLANVNRLVARDDAQSPAAVKFIKETLKASSVFLIHDKTAYGQGLADEMKKNATAQGMKVDGYEGITPGDKDFSAVLSKVKSTGTPVVYFGGSYPEAAQMLKQIKEKGINVKFVGADGIDSGDLVKLAGDAANGVYYTSVVNDITKSAEGQAFAKRYAEYAKKELDSFASYSYDASQVIVNALLEYAKANPGKAPSRKELAELVRKTSGFKGVSGTITFDQKGDNKDAKVYMYQVQNSKYPGVQIQ